VTEEELERLIKQGETDKVDFKRSILGGSSPQDREKAKDELAKDVAAIANVAGGDGYLIVGVNDDGSPAPSLPVVREEQLQQVVHRRVSPPVFLEVTTVPYQGNNVTVITVKESELRPHQVKARQAGHICIPIRRGKTTDYVTDIAELTPMLQERGLLIFGRVKIRSAPLESLDIEAIRDYLSQKQPLDKGPITPDSRNGRILQEHGLIVLEARQLVPTALGLLVFGIEPQLHLPHCTIRAKKHYGRIDRASHWWLREI